MGTRRGMSGKTARDYAGTYTEPELRERLKEEIKAGSRGGRPGQWSARKSQLLTHEYEAAGGGYTAGGPTESQAHLHEWTEQEWQTAEGSDRARDGDETARYLPKAAWEKLTPAERRATDAKKRGGGEQHVANTPAGKEAAKAAELSELTVAEARGRLGSLSDAELERAKRGEGRKTLVEAIERELKRRGG